MKNKKLQKLVKVLDYLTSIYCSYSYVIINDSLIVNSRYNLFTSYFLVVLQHEVDKLNLEFCVSTNSDGCCCLIFDF